MDSQPPTTFAAYGRSLGLAEDRVLDALVAALRVAGPSNGGRYVTPNHLVSDDATSRAAIDALTRASRS